MDRKGILVVLMSFNEANESLNRERVVLHGDTEFFSTLFGGDELVFHQTILFKDLPGVSEKLCSLRGDGDASVGAQEERDIQLIFEILYGSGEGRLRNEELFGCFIDAAAVGDFNGVAHLLKSHESSS